jgi:hypothetical protein
MNRFFGIKAVSFAALMMALTLASASAESIQGQVVSVDQSGQSVTIRPSETSELRDSGQGEILTLRLNQQTQYSGIGSFEELEVGDQISVQASQAGSDWQVQTLQPLGAGAVGAAESNANALSDSQAMGTNAGTGMASDNAGASLSTEGDAATAADAGNTAGNATQL